ncbi:alpha/beta fold hydrolase [Streptomyces sp. Wb2n-11]|uniref:alpha/beta fold hydrolase n=1 Tax=Streptomyces sp. Wb2n-11 TaxID=1030533 RepID=UPI000A6B8F35|nr:alpha/beta fold hydrolase [Streptomyces sp. Wb2n-11]
MFAALEHFAGAGTTLRGHSAGERGRPAVVIASACGMPAALCEPWMRHLADSGHHVVTWETRGLFGDVGPGSAAAFDALAHDVGAQAGDLLALMDHHGIASAHVMGLCGGAVIALRAAARRPDRVSSLSLWHGDFSGTPGPMTGHQQNLRALLALAAQSRQDASAINAALADSTRAGVPAEVADLVMYPYSGDELFYRYSALTLATMTEDITPALDGLDIPTLIVTSEDDHTAHPDGSHRVAARLPGAELRVEPHGDHLSVFAAGRRLQQVLADFVGGTSVLTPRA